MWCGSVQSKAWGARGPLGACEQSTAQGAHEDERCAGLLQASREGFARAALGLWTKDCGLWAVDYTERPCAPLDVRPRSAPIILCSAGNLRRVDPSQLQPAS